MCISGLVRVGQVSDLPSLRGAGPGPLLHSIDQSCPHRIPFDVLHDTGEFLAVAYPAVEGFFLPEPQPNSVENKIGLTGASALDRACYLPQRFAWLQENMNVVRHDHKCEEFIQLPFAGGDDQGLHNCFRYSRILKNRWPGFGRIELPIQQEEAPPFRSGAGLRLANFQVARQRPVQAPSQKYRTSLGLPMRQPTTIEAHETEVASGLQDSQAAGRRPAPQAAPICPF